MIELETPQPPVQVSPRIDIYAPLGWDLTEHLTRVSAYNHRAARPTAWCAEARTAASRASSWP